MFFLDNLMPDNCGGLGNIVALVKYVLSIALIIIGVVLIVLVIIDIAKSIIASEEKEVKGYQKAAIRRVIYFIIIFFVVTIVNLVFGLVGQFGDDIDGDGKEINWGACWKDPTGKPSA